MSLIVLGIDPGLRVTGYGVIVKRGQQSHYLGSGCIRTQTTDLASRLWQIHQGLSEVMLEFRPQAVAIEQVFMRDNASSALKLGHARGAAVVAVASHGHHIHEYAPRLVKQTVVGYGNSTKAQIAHMVKRLLEVEGTLAQDAADALAVALCNVSHLRMPLSSNLYYQ